jgi:hypothetical protein
MEKTNPKLVYHFGYYAELAGIKVKVVKSDDDFEPQYFQIFDHRNLKVGTPAPYQETLDELRIQAAYSKN